MHAHRHFGAGGQAVWSERASVLERAGKRLERACKRFRSELASVFGASGQGVCHRQGHGQGHRLHEASTRAPNGLIWFPPVSSGFHRFPPPVSSTGTTRLKTMTVAISAQRKATHTEYLFIRNRTGLRSSILNGLTTWLCLGRVSAKGE